MTIEITPEIQSVWAVYLNEEIDSSFNGKKIPLMNDYTLLHPQDFKELINTNYNEYLHQVLSPKHKVKDPTVLGVPLELFRSFRHQGVTYIENRFSLEGEFITPRMPSVLFKPSD